MNVKALLARLTVAAAACLGGCGGLALAPTGVVPTGSSATSRDHSGRSWMDAGLAKYDLLYVSNGNGLVNVYRYWQHNLVGVLGDFKTTLGLCVDQTGDVYVADYRAKKVYEYSHGAMKATRAINVSPYSPYSCTVDPSSGDLAVVNYTGGSRGQGNIAVYRHAEGKPIIYTSPYLYRFRSAAYDDSGNLLTTNGNGFSSSYYYSYFAYLPKNGVKLVPVTLPPPYPSSSWEWFLVQGIQFDGRYWVIDDGPLYRYTISGSSAEFVSQTNLSAEVGPIWLYRKTPDARATQVVGGLTSRSKSAVDYWKYPAGGESIAEISHGVAEPFGVAISRKR